MGREKGAGLGRGWAGRGAAADSRSLCGWPCISRPGAGGVTSARPQSVWLPFMSYCSFSAAPPTFIPILSASRAESMADTEGGSAPTEHTQAASSSGSAAAASSQPASTSHELRVPLALRTRWTRLTHS